MHQVVDAGEEQPLAAPQPPNKRVHKRTGLLLVTGDLASSPLDNPLRRGQAPKQRLPRGIGSAWDARHNSGSIGRPAPRGGQRARHRQTGPRLGCMAKRLRDVPVALTARQGKGSPRQNGHHRRQRVGHGCQLRGHTPSRTRASPAANLAANGDKASVLNPAPGSDDVGCRCLQRLEAPARGSDDPRA